MKTIAFPILLVLATLKCGAQDYLISFTGTGDTSLVNTVKVDNLTSGESVTINGTDILHLTSTFGIYRNQLTTGNLRVFPNPFTDKFFLTITNPVSGNIVLKLIGLSGQIIQEFTGFLPAGESVFYMSGLRQGVFLLNAEGEGFTYTSKLVSSGASRNSTEIVFVSSKGDFNNAGLKSMAGIVDMLYHSGDRLLINGISGQYSSVVSLVPGENSTVSFDFYACRDAEGNNYRTVRIGSQIWMAENMKTTILNNGDLIPEVADSSAWVTSDTPGFCWYNNNAAYKDTYGALYNWFVIATSQLAPPGWHVPTDAEWTELSDFLGGDLISGGKLKETGTFHWQSVNIGSNESGFSALPGGIRALSFGGIGNWGYWWSSTAYMTFSEAYSRAVRNDYVNLYNWTEPKKYGLSVRCVMN